jgi:hypothetical protein
MPLQATSGAASYDAFGGGVAAVPQYIEDVFSTWLYTGTGANQTITNGIDLATKGGLVWGKARSNSSHYLIDTVRGGDKLLLSNDTTSQLNLGVSYLNAQTTGYQTGPQDAGWNFSGLNYASWTFREQPKFFDVVTYTGTDSANTIAHNLGSIPGAMIVKRIDSASGWSVWHTSLPTSYGRLDATSAFTTSAAEAIFGNGTTTVSPTSTNFTVGTSPTVNASGGTYVAYLFAHDAGGFGLTGTDNVISCGSFTTDGSGQATISLGYEPQWVLYKRTDSSSQGDWNLSDNMRGWTNPANNSILYPNLSAAETTGAGGSVPNATGFTYSNGGIPGSSWIYIAIRRGPMKVPTTGTSVFQAALRTGTGAAATVTGINFPPDLAILGNRTIVNTRNFWDRLRGVGRYLGPHTVGAEANNATTVTSFNMNGISLGSDATNTANYTGSTFVNYYFRRAPGFFDEVCYTGSGAARTVTHNLGVVPELIIVKSRSDSYLWAVYSAATGNTKSSELNSTAVPQTVNWWNNTTPTASVFSLFASLPFTPNQQINGSGITYVAYLFATCPGVSKVGTYTGNGTTQAIACGFTGGARFVLIKRTDSTGDWYVYDTARGMTTLTDPYLFFNSAVAETATLGSVTTTTGGFTVDASILAAINTNAATYIFLAIA